MQFSRKFVPPLFAALLWLTPTAALSQSDYNAGLEAWHLKRLEDLKAPNGWLNLTGLFWLNPGKNSFGSDPSNDIVYADPGFPAHAGTFELADGNVNWTTAEGSTILLQGDPFSKGPLFLPGGTAALQLATGHYIWNIIKRDDRYGVRFRDLQSPALLHFTDIERFAVDTTWQISGHLEAAVNKSIFITNVLGQTNAQQSPGKLVFQIGGKSYSLDALDEGGEDLFIVFGDATTGETTYPSGRFLYVKKPGADGNTIIDFNKAINPPCAFTKYATCPLPPPQNILPIAITAGEKDFGHH